MPHDFTPIQESIVTPLVYDADAKIVIRGKYDHSKYTYIPEQVTAHQASEAFTAAEYLDKSLSALKSSVDDVRQYLIGALQSGDIDVDVAQEIAERLGIELSKKLRVEFTVRYYATVSVPLDTDLDESDFRVQIDSSADGDWDDEDYDIEDFSAEEIDSY